MENELEGREVMISIKGLSGFDDEGNTLELVTAGRYSYEGGRAAFEYMETELTGLGGTKTLIQAAPGEVMLTRTGTCSMQMLFEEGRKHYFNYQTPYGYINMGITGRSIRSTLGEEGGRLIVSYLLDLDNTMQSRNEIEINIKP